MNSRILACGLVCLFSLDMAYAQNRTQTAQPKENGANADASQWPYEYMRGDVVVPCLDDEQENCIWHRLIVDNQSDNTLECRGRMTYDGVDRDH